MSVGQCITDQEQIILDIDEVYAEMIGRDRRDVIGARALSFTYAADLGRNQPILDALCRGEAGFAITKRYIRGDGSLIWVENQVTAIPGRDGRLICAASRAVDRPFGVDRLTLNHRHAARLCQAFVAGRQLFGEDVVSAPPAEALLCLYKAELEGAAMNVELLARHADVPASTMRRWVQFLVERGLVEIEGDAPLLATTQLRISRRCEIALDGLLKGFDG